MIHSARSGGKVYDKRVFIHYAQKLFIKYHGRDGVYYYGIPRNIFCKSCDKFCLISCTLGFCKRRKLSCGYSHICADSPKKLGAGFRYSAIANNQDGGTVHGDSKLLHGYLQSALRRGDTISYNKLLSLIIILNIEAERGEIFYLITAEQTACHE